MYPSLINSLGVLSTTIATIVALRLSLLNTRPKLKSIIEEFQLQKKNDTLMKDVSYLMVISGSASKFQNDNSNENYILSYKRALSLHEFWRENLGLDFDSPKYHDIIELQISGVGFGGVGRFNSPYNSKMTSEEEKNQRFIIHIAPKIGK